MAPHVVAAFPYYHKPVMVASGSLKDSDGESQCMTGLKLN